MGRNLFSLRSMDEAYEAIDAVRAATDEAGYAIVRGVIPMKDVEGYRSHVRNLFSPAKELRISGEYQKGWSDFQRLDLGEYPASTRFARYFFFFPWNNDRQFSAISEAQMRMFNLMSRQEPTFGLPGDDDPKRFRMSYVIQYPIGGGFMSKHREYSVGKNDKAYVVYLALTTRGQDFRKGGAYVCIDDKQIDIEENVQASDLVVYRGEMYHGVNGVDRDLPVRLDEVCGRMILTTQIKSYPK